MFHHSPPFGSPGFEAADVLTYLLADGKSSRLYRKLVYEKRIAQDIAAQVWPTEDCGLSFIVATARPGVDADSLERGIVESLEEVRGGGLRDAEVEGAVNRALRELVNLLDSVGQRSDAIATAATFLGRPAYVNEIFDRVRRITREDVLAAMNAWLNPEYRATLFVVPESKGSE